MVWSIMIYNMWDIFNAPLTFVPISGPRNHNTYKIYYYILPSRTVSDTGEENKHPISIDS